MNLVMHITEGENHKTQSGAEDRCRETWGFAFKLFNMNIHDRSGHSPSYVNSLEETHLFD